MPDKLALVPIILAFDVGQAVLLHTARRRRLVPRQTGQRISQPRSSRLEIFHQRRAFFTRVCIVAARREFRLETPAGLRRRIDARNQVHQFREGRNRILQTEVHAQQHAGVRFVSERRSLRRGTLALVQGGDAKHGTSTHAVKVQRKFRTGAQQKLVVNFEQGFAFVAHLDFLVRIKSAFTQKFNLAELIVDFVVRSADKSRRSRRHLFCTRRNIHTGTSAHRIARTWVSHAQHGIATLTYRFKIEAVRVALEVVNRKRIELSHRRRGIKVTHRFQAILLGQFIGILRTAVNRIRRLLTGEPHFTRVCSRSVLLENRSVIHQRCSRGRIHQAKFLEVIPGDTRFVHHAQNETRRTRIRNANRIHITQHELVDIDQFRKGCVPLNKGNRIPFFHRGFSATVFRPARRKQGVAVHAVHLHYAHFRIVSKVRIRNLNHALHELHDRFSARRRVPNINIINDTRRTVRDSALIKPEFRGFLVPSPVSADGRIDVVPPDRLIQEVVAVSDKLLIENLELRRRFTGLQAELFLVATVLRGNRRKAPVTKFPVGLDTEQPLVVLGITREFRTRQGEVRGTGFYTLQNVVLEFVLVRFFVNNTHLVAGAQPFFHVVDFNRDVRADLALHHEVRRIVQSRAGPQTRLGATFGVILFAVALQADIHRSLEHQLRLVQAKVAHPRGHCHGNRDVEHRTHLGGLVSVVRLPDQVVQPQALLADTVHVRHIVRKFRIMRRPQGRRVTRNGVHALFAHVHFTGRDIDIVTKDLPLAGTHQTRRRTDTAERQKSIQRGRRRRQRYVLVCRLPLGFSRIRLRGFSVTGRHYRNGVALGPGDSYGKGDSRHRPQVFQTIKKHSLLFIQVPIKY